MTHMVTGNGERCHSQSVRGNDLYETPDVAVRSLLAVEDVPQTIWEPACGPGAIVAELRNAGRCVIATDLIDYDCPESVAKRDFLMEQKAPASVEAIVTNPPFKLAQEFVEHARLMVPKTIMLLRLAFLESERRRKLFSEGDLARVWVFSKRLPMMHRAGWDGPKANSGMAFAWFVWDRNHTGSTTINWLDWKQHQ